MKPKDIKQEIKQLLITVRNGAMITPVIYQILSLIQEEKYPMYLVRGRDIIPVKLERFKEAIVKRLEREKRKHKGNSNDDVKSEVWAHNKAIDLACKIIKGE